MADRTCPSCGAVVGPRLKFCRECGARVEDGPADAAPAGPSDGSGDETIVGPAVRGPAAAPLPAAAGSGDETIIAGAMKAPPRPAPPAPVPDPAGEPAAQPLTATFIGTALPGMEPGAAPPAPLPATPAAPPPAAPAQEAEEAEPVSDDFEDVDDDSGSTLLQATPPPSLGAPKHAAPPPPPAPPPPAGAVRLEHWSPRVKNDFVTIDKDEVVVGRDRGDLKYPDDSFLSKKHARFFHGEGGRLMVEDLGGLNGTYLRLRAPAKLEHRDVVILGRHAFRFELLQYEEKDDRTIEGDPLTRVQGVQGSAPRARLVKRQEEGFRGVPFFFGIQRYVLGRTDGTHNFQKDDLMSRRHAALSFKDGEYWLEDLGSQNGTFLRLRGPRALESGDIVKMGDQYFKLA